MSCYSWAKQENGEGTPVNALQVVGVVGLTVMVTFGALFGIGTWAFYTPFVHSKYLICVALDGASVVLIPGCLLPAMLSSLLQLEALVHLHWRSEAVTKGHLREDWGNRGKEYPGGHRRCEEAEAAKRTSSGSFAALGDRMKSIDIDSQFAEKHVSG